MLPGGWLRTGDLGLLDGSGCLWLMGRAKDMIKSGGENVFAAEVESGLLSHPAVRAAVVVGVPDARLGERVAALLVLQEGWRWREPGREGQQPGPGGAGRSIGPVQLLQHLRAAGLSGYKAPRLMAAAASLPLNSSGKVVRAEAREALVRAERAQAGQLRSRL
jgi:acyl-activating enzyme 14